MKMTALFGHNIARGSGGGGGEDDRINPKPIKKLSLVAESYVTINWKRVTLGSMSSVLIFNLFVQRMDSVSQRINHYPPDKYW